MENTAYPNLQIDLQKLYKKMLKYIQASIAMSIAKLRLDIFKIYCIPSPIISGISDINIKIELIFIFI